MRSTLVETTRWRFESSFMMTLDGCLVTHTTTTLARRLTCGWVIIIKCGLLQRTLSIHTSSLKKLSSDNDDDALYDDFDKFAHCFFLIFTWKSFYYGLESKNQFSTSWSLFAAFLLFLVMLHLKLETPGICKLFTWLFTLNVHLHMRRQFFLVSLIVLPKKLKALTSC